MKYKIENHVVQVYTDGACEKNPGKGGWAFIAKVSGQPELIKVSGFEEFTTNNRMELTAVLKCLEYFNEMKEFVIFSDNTYVVNSINLWIYSWKRKGWTNNSGLEVKNVDLLQKINDLITFHKVTMVWIRGKNGDKYNEMVNELEQLTQKVN